MRLLSITISLMILQIFTAKGQTDTLYIKQLPQEFSIRSFVYKKFTSLEIETDGKNQVNYEPNTPVGIGVGFTYKDFTLNIAYAPPFFRDKKRGKTNFLDFQYHYYGRKFIYDLFIQNYKGFYTTINEKKELYEHYPDLRIQQYGFTGHYLFNHKKLSYKAAFYCDELQLRSAGSFQVGAGVYYNNLKTNGTEILEESNRFENFQFCVMGGYVYSWIIKKEYFITLGVSAGVNLSFGNNNVSKKMEVTPNVFPRYAMGYNSSKWALYISTVLNRTCLTSNSSREIRLDSGRVQLTYVYRFGEGPKVLKNIKFLN